MEPARSPSFDVIVISDTEPDLLARAEATFRDLPAGRVALSLRRPELGANALYELAHALRALTRARGVQLFVNDRVDVARAVDADGVQLPERGLSPATARRLLAEHASVGVSRHDLRGLAASSDANFAIVSPIHAVPDKGTALGFSGLQALCGMSALPVYALGGLSARDVPALRAAGARGLALIRGVWAAPDPRAALTAMLAGFDADVAPLRVRG